MEWTPDNWQDAQAKLAKTMSIDVYRTDAVVIRTYECTRKVIPPDETKVGGQPSHKSLQRLIFLLNNSDVPMKTMVTITLHRDVSFVMSVDEHKALLHASLQRLRRQGATQYCWVREHQENGTPHWHIFTDHECSDGVDKRQSIDWSNWVANYCHKYCLGEGLKRPLFYMSEGDGKDFLGCTRVERLRDDAAGRYAGKEGAKRFQKVAPFKWQESGRWWAASRSIKCTPTKRVQVPTYSLKSTTIKLESGHELEVPFKLQFSRGFNNDEG